MSLFGTVFDATVGSSLRVVGSTLDLIDGLTEGEIRTRAIASLGAEYVSNMTQSELIEWYRENC